MSEHGREWPKIRILAYIEARYGPEFPPSEVGRDELFDINGFTLDVTIEVAYGVRPDGLCRIVQHYGDGVSYPILEIAAEKVYEETGVKVERVEIPEKARFDTLKVAAYFVGEFSLTAKSRNDVVADSVFPRNRDLSRPSVPPEEDATDQRWISRN
jgi:hypothetical protein